MRSFRTHKYLQSLDLLPDRIRHQADKAFVQWLDFMENSTFYDGLNWECVDREEDAYTVRVALDYRAMCFRDGSDYVWFWIGTKEEWRSRFG